jgi:glycosidase
VAASPPAAPWLPPPAGWGERSVAAQTGDPDSFLTLYREALRIRRWHPALGAGLDGSHSMRWLESPGDALFFARDPGFLFLANLGTAPLRLPAFREVLLASGPLIPGAAGFSDGSLPPRHGRLARRLIPSLPADRTPRMITERKWRYILRQ